MHTQIPMHAKLRKETEIETYIAMEVALLISHKNDRCPKVKISIRHIFPSWNVLIVMFTKLYTYFIYIYIYILFFLYIYIYYFLYIYTLAPWTLPLFDISSVTRKITFIRNYRYNR